MNFKINLGLFLALCQILVPILAKQIPLSEINSKTVMIAELFRHGARYQTENTFNEPEVEKNLGMLTATGMRQHYVLGKAIVKAYPDLFSDTYDHNQIEIITDHNKRTYESAQSHFIGMYDLLSGDKLKTNKTEFIDPPFNKNQNDRVPIKDMPYALNGGYRTFPIVALDNSNDRLLMHMIAEVCPNASELTKQSQEKLKPRLDKATKQNSDELIKLGLDPKKMFGHEFFTAENQYRLFDTWRVYRYQDGKIKEPIDKKMYNYLKLINAAYFTMNWATEDLAKIWTQPLTLDIIDSFNKKINDPNYKQNYRGFSGHDSNIYPFMRQTGMNSFDCLIKELETGVEDPSCYPTCEFAANIVWELNSVQDPNDKTKTEYLVRMLYNGKPMYSCNDAYEKGYLKAEPKYEGYCTLDEFIESSKSAFELGNSFEKICTGKEEKRPETLSFIKSIS